MQHRPIHRAKSLFMILRVSDSVSGPSSRCSVLRPVCSPQVFQGNEVHRNTQESACDPLSPRIRELDACDFGQNVNPDRRNSDLIDHLLPGECLRSDPIMLEAPNFLSAPTTRAEFCGELWTHTSRSFVYRGSPYFMTANPPTIKYSISNSFKSCSSSL